MRRAASGQQGDAEARRAADRLREATNLLGGAQQQHANGRLDQMSREADRLAQEEKTQSEKLGQMPGPQGITGRFGQPQYGSSTKEQYEEAQKLADERQRLADDLAGLQKQLRDAQRDLASNQRPAANKLRDALGDLDSNDIENRIQRSADWLRRGYNPNSADTEQQIASGLQKLSDQVRQAQQALGQGQPQGSDTALDRVERVRNQLQAMNPGGRNGQAGQRGQQGQGLQPGQGSQTGQGSQSAEGGRGDNQPGSMANGYSSRGSFGTTLGGGDRGGSTRYGDVDTGNNPQLPQPVAPSTAFVPGDLQRNIDQGSQQEFQRNIEELGQLRQQLQDDPEATRQVDTLIQEMQRLDPRRFTGNPGLTEQLHEQLHAQVLNDVDKLALQLRRQAEDKSGQVRSTDSAHVPPGYQDAVADYFRRLSKTR